MNLKRRKQQTEHFASQHNAQIQEDQSYWTEDQKKMFKEVLLSLLKRNQLKAGSEKDIVSNMDQTVAIMAESDQDFMNYQK